MGRETILLMDTAGRIVWANRAAHEVVRQHPGELLGRNYLEFCPPETRAELLDLHLRKLAGETVRFRIDLGTTFDVISGPVTLGDRTYLFAVGRESSTPSPGDEAAAGLLAAGDLLGASSTRLDLNACVIGALKDDVAIFKGRIRLDPGPVPRLRGSLWPVCAVLRSLLRAMLDVPGPLSVSTGADARRAWIRIVPPAPVRLSPSLRARCRASLKSQGGTLRSDRRGATMSFRRR